MKQLMSGTCFPLPSLTTWHCALSSNCYLSKRSTIWTIWTDKESRPARLPMVLKEKVSPELDHQSAEINKLQSKSLVLIMFIMCTYNISTHKWKPFKFTVYKKKEKHSWVSTARLFAAPPCEIWDFDSKTKCTFLTPMVGTLLETYPWHAKNQSRINWRIC